MAERRVMFYECQSIEKRPEFDRLRAVEGINDLTDEAWRVHDRSLDSDLAVIVDRAGSASGATHLRFLRIRADAPFKLSAARKLQPVEVAQDESITEFTWAVLWPDCFLGAINLRDAPGHKKLATYFSDTSGQQTHIVNLFRPDVVQRLKELRKHLRRVQVKLRTSAIAQIEADNRSKGWGQFFRAATGTDAATLGLELTMGRSDPSASLDDDLGLGAVVLAEHVDMLESMHVAGYNNDGQKEEINMKHERIGGPVEIDYGASNDAVYRAIERARHHIEKDIGPLDSGARGS